MKASGTPSVPQQHKELNAPRDNHPGTSHSNCCPQDLPTYPNPKSGQTHGQMAADSQRPPVNGSQAFGLRPNSTSAANYGATGCFGLLIVLVAISVVCSLFSTSLILRQWLSGVHVVWYVVYGFAVIVSFIRKFPAAMRGNTLTKVTCQFKMLTLMAPLLAPIVISGSLVGVLVGAAFALYCVPLVAYIIWENRYGPPRGSS